MKKKLFKGYMALIYAMILFFYLVSDFVARDVDQWKFFYMFTQQSNIIVMVWLLLFGLGCFMPEKFNFVKNKTVMVAVTVYISITFFIVMFILSPFYSGHFNPILDPTELILHTLTPVVMWIYFFDVKAEGNMDIKKTPLILIYPLCFAVLNLIVGASVTYNDGKRAYAYSFINPDSYGSGYIMLFFVIIGLLAVFSAFSIGLLKLKNKIDSFE